MCLSLRFYVFRVQVFEGLGSLKARDFEGRYEVCVGLGFFRVWVS